MIVMRKRSFFLFFVHVFEEIEISTSNQRLLFRILLFTGICHCIGFMIIVFVTKTGARCLVDFEKIETISKTDKCVKFAKTMIITVVEQFVFLDWFFVFVLFRFTGSRCRFDPNKTDRLLIGGWFSVGYLLIAGAALIAFIGPLKEVSNAVQDMVAPGTDPVCVFSAYNGT